MPNSIGYFAMQDDLAQYNNYLILFLKEAVFLFCNHVQKIIYVYMKPLFLCDLNKQDMYNVRKMFEIFVAETVV